MSLRNIFLVGWSLCWSITVLGYEVETHGAITAQIYTRSALEAGNLLTMLGLVEGDSPFGDTGHYYDVSGAKVHERTAVNYYEEKKINSIGGQPFSIKGWMMQGAIRGDDITWNHLCQNPPPKNLSDDDYPEPPDRPVNHFYNPVNDRGLNAGITGAKATDWGLGVQDAFAQPPVVNTSRDNHYTLVDAREAMYRSKRGHSDYFPAHQLPSSHVLT